jgi:hypothetical protein
VCCVYGLVSGVSKWLPKWDFTSLQKALSSSVTGFHMLPYSGQYGRFLNPEYGTYGRKGPKFHIWRGLVISDSGGSASVRVSGAV